MKLILWLFKRLTESDQQALVLKLVALVYPDCKIYRARPSGYKRPRDKYQVPKE